MRHSKSRWSRGTTKDGYHVRAGAKIWTEVPWGGGVNMCSPFDVVGVDVKGRAMAVLRGSREAVPVTLRAFTTEEV